MPTSRAGKTRSKAPQVGFTYAAVLVAVVAVGLVAETAHSTTWRIVRADREAELLFRGQAYRRAIESFHKANGRFPRALDDLVKDPHAPSRRHLRQLYDDAMGGSQWTLVRASDGGIAGVASASKEVPLKLANFPPGLEKFSGARAYADWIFEYTPSKTPAPPARRPPTT